MPLQLPDFPWDALEPYKAQASAHPDGIVDLSVGSPVDPTPDVIREALAAATDAHSYPLTVGTVALREAIVAWYSERRGVHDLTVANVLPTIGSKEFIAGLPLWLGFGPGDVMVQPTLAYPTYAVGAVLAGMTVVSSDDPAEWPDNTKLVWVNSPGNPDGRILSTQQLAVAVARARQIGAVIASDECYAELGWEAPYVGNATPSILDPLVIQGERHSVLSVYSLSKQSNLAGYRAGFVAGCSDLIAELLAVRKNLGTMPPTPVQAAMVVALGEHGHVAAQRQLYGARRMRLRDALEAAGFTIDSSEGGLYLWATRGQPTLVTVGELAAMGILVTPGPFYGDRGAKHVRIALTATDAAIDTAVQRLGAAHDPHADAAVTAAAN
ncbi:MAG: dapC [Microbacteriaceae bacterium]|nr:dapC [Microbacteriaceae bacterium]